MAVHLFDSRELNIEAPAMRRKDYENQIVADICEYLFISLPTYVCTT